MSRFPALPTYGMPSVENRFHSMDIELINYCANNCVFCCARDRSPRRKIMAVEDLKILLDRVPGFKGNVTLSDTGDPLLLDDLPLKIRLIKESWPESVVNITTTLSVARSEAYFRELFSSGLDQILLSLYAFDKDDYAKLQGSRKYENVLNNLRHIAKVPDAPRKLYLKDMTNFNEIYPVDDYERKKRDFLEFYRGLGYDNIFPTIVLPVVPDEIEGDYWNAPVPCNVVWGERAGMCEIHADLDIAPCCLFPNDKVTFGNLREQSLEEIFNGDKAKDFRRKWREMRHKEIPVCRRCKCYDMSVNNWEENDRIALWIADKLKGQDVLFMGNGSAWRRYACFFNDSKPIAMILEDNPGSLTEFEGIPVQDISVLADKSYAKTPLVIFAYRKEARKILTKIYDNFDRSIKTIFVCPPWYVREENGNIFYYDKI
ncbi:MAG: radical SAM protein [Desulfovibrio sp.]|nr:radical SAM protein [Desulfovibrio sp.]